MEPEHTIAPTLAQIVATLTEAGVDCDYAPHTATGTGDIIIYDQKSADNLLGLVTRGMRRR